MGTSIQTAASAPTTKASLRSLNMIPG